MSIESLPAPVAAPERADDTARRTLRSSVILVLLALFLSGVAAIVNQTVWQRALKVYLSGSEAISSMIVVLVFMLGLGAGSLAVARVARRVRNPLRLLAIVEIALAVVNLAISAALALDISESIYAFQRAAVSIGIPLRLLYAAVSTVILLIPCFLMGVTMPLVSEAAQRQLRAAEGHFVTVLFFLNTLGAVAGGLASGYFLMPYLGQQKALIYAAALNGIAGVVLVALYAVRYRENVPAHEPALPEEGQPEERAQDRKASRSPLRPLEIAGFWLGFLALAYEMYLFRIAPLAYYALPYTFSAVLCVYLLFWSVGVFVSRWFRGEMITPLALTAALILIIPDLFFMRAWSGGLIGFAAVFSLPCIGFGIAFGQVVSRISQHNWGTDVGRFYGLNTLGSCLGILVTVLGGYQFAPTFLAWALAAGYVLLLTYLWLRQPDPELKQKAVRWRIAGVLAAAFAYWISYAPAFTVRLLDPKITRAYYSPEGVVEVRLGRQMVWDGLWHSDLSVTPGDHIGTKNWQLGAVPLMCHSGEGMKDALVIGLGTGITVATLARSEDVRSVDVYEINHDLKQLLHDYYEGTLGVVDNPKVSIAWQDGRTGLALRDKSYDVITQQPVYLKQAGSSLLLSREYMELVKKRLKPGGIFCIYCNTFGNEAQALVVRKTAQQVFKYCESFGKGYMIIASNDPIPAMTPETVKARLGRLPADSVLGGEVATYGVENFAALHDRPRLDWENSPLIVTDNHPIVEYPDVAEAIVKRHQQRKW